MTAQRIVRERVVYVVVRALGMMMVMPGRFTTRLAELQLNSYDNESFEESLQLIADDGVYKLHVMGDDHSLSWSYTTGNFDTWGQPEVLLSGFPGGLAGSVMEAVAERNRACDFILPERRVPGLLRKVDCMLRPMTTTWIQRLMLRTTWFYGDIEFPAMQIVCPDFDNVFPWEPGFDPAWRERQALLFTDVRETSAEKNLWNVSSRDIVN